MKKLIPLILLLIPFSVFAEAPSGVYGFLDGKYYDIKQNLKYLCFSDNNCYNLEQEFVFKRDTIVAPTPPPSSPSDVPFIATPPITPPANLQLGQPSPNSYPIVPPSQIQPDIPTPPKSLEKTNFGFYAYTITPKVVPVGSKATVIMETFDRSRNPLSDVKIVVTHYGSYEKGRSDLETNVRYVEPPQTLITGNDGKIQFTANVVGLGGNFLRAILTKPLVVEEEIWIPIPAVKDGQVWDSDTRKGAGAGFYLSESDLGKFTECLKNNERGVCIDRHQR